jgi:hypothetical protein
MKGAHGGPIGRWGSLTTRPSPDRPCRQGPWERNQAQRRDRSAVFLAELAMPWTGGGWSSIEPNCPGLGEPAGRPPLDVVGDPRVRWSHPFRSRSWDHEFRPTMAYRSPCRRPPSGDRGLLAPQVRSDAPGQRRASARSPRSPLEGWPDLSASGGLGRRILLPTDPGGHRHLLKYPTSLSWDWKNSRRRKEGTPRVDTSHGLTTHDPKRILSLFPRTSDRRREHRLTFSPRSAVARGSGDRSNRIGGTHT